MALFSSLLTVWLFSWAAYVCAISDMAGHLFSTFKTLGFFYRNISRIFSNLCQAFLSGFPAVASAPIAFPFQLS